MTKYRKLSPVALLLVAGAVAAPMAMARTFTVTTPYEKGTGTLNQAIKDANSNPGRDTIEFNIDTSRNWVFGQLDPIGPNGEIVIDSNTADGTNTSYSITDEVIIDGTTQPGYNGTPIIICRGLTFDDTIPTAPPGGAYDGGITGNIFFIQGADAAGTMIKGLQMCAFTSNGVGILNGADGCRIEDNYIGFHIYDGDAFPNFNIAEVPDDVTPRGIAAAVRDLKVRRNTVSGVDNAIVIGDNAGGSAYPGNEIRNNFIGTSHDGKQFVDSNGDTVWGNTSDGVFTFKGVANVCLIGPGNTISNNQSAGVEIFDVSNVGMICFRNRLGTDDTGNAPLGNGELGVLIANGANFCAVGGPFGGNTISGNVLGGVSLGGGGNGPVTTIYVQNNFIGCNSTRNAVVGSQQTGIGIENSSGNAIEYNMIVGQTGNAILLSNSPTNLVSGNALGLTDAGLQAANGGYGIFFLNGSNFNYIGGYFAPKPFNYIGPNMLGAFGSQGSGGNIPGLDF